MKPKQAILYNKYLNLGPSYYFTSLISFDDGNGDMHMTDIESEAYVFPSINQARKWARGRKNHFGGAKFSTGKWWVKVKP